MPPEYLDGYLMTCRRCGRTLPPYCIGADRECVNVQLCERAKLRRVVEEKKRRDGKD